MVTICSSMLWRTQHKFLGDQFAAIRQGEKEIEKTEKEVVISVERGTMGNGMRTETKVFSISSKKEKKLSPINAIWNRPKQRGKDYYKLLAGQKYCIETTSIKNGKGFSGLAILVVDKNNGTTEVEIVEWKGSFCPQFSIVS